MAILSDLNRSGQTLVLVTHDERLARSAATRVVRLIDGAILDDRRDAAHGLVEVQ
jgi:putative ABC transport system ATP-binding protein